MFCRNCGEENSNEAIFCRNCGEKLKNEDVKKAEVIEQNTNNQNTTSNSHPKSSLGWIGCCCFGVIIVFILFVILTGL